MTDPPSSTIPDPTAADVSQRTVRVGDMAPDFALPDQSGAAVRLSDFRGRPVVVFFYPKNHTPACTAEACAFRDQETEFSQRGIVVLGVSSDSVQSHARFAGKHRLPFRLLADVGGRVRRSWGVPRALGIFPGRVTYAIDATGRVCNITSTVLSARRHIDETLASLDQTPSEKHR